MKYTPDHVETGKYLLGSDMRRVCTLAAGRTLATARALVGKESGETAASGRLEHGIGGIKHDRVRVSVTFDGAAVEQQWGTARSRGTHFLTRALVMG